MRLVYSKYDIQIELSENQIVQLIIESSRDFSEVVGELYEQCNGGEGNFILSEIDKTKSLNKDAELVMNPFALDCNDKKIQQKLYQEISFLCRENMIEETAEIQKSIIAYMDTLTGMMPYNLDFDIEDNVNGLIKLVNLRIDSTATTLLERIVEYMKALHQFCRIQLFLFVNLKSFLTTEDLEKLYEFSFYEKVYILIVENKQTAKIKHEKTFILDADKCIICIE